MKEYRVELYFDINLSRPSDLLFENFTSTVFFGRKNIFVDIIISFA